MPANTWVTIGTVTKDYYPAKTVAYTMQTAGGLTIVQLTGGGVLQIYVANAISNQRIYLDFCYI